MIAEQTIIEQIKQLLRQSGIPGDIKASYLAILPYLPESRIMSMMGKLEREQILLNAA